MTTNSQNNTLLGFSKGSIAVTDATGKILQQAAPAAGYVLTGSTTSSTGLTSVALPSPTGSTIPNYYSAGVTKWVNSRQANVPNYYVADSTGTVYIGNSAATSLDCSKVNVDGGMAVSSALPGTITINQYMVSGTGTTFLSSFQVGDTIYLPSFGQSRKVVQINSNTELLVDSGDNFSFADWYVGSAAPTISTAQSKFGGSSLFFNGAQNADMYFYYSSNINHQYEFTIEGFYYFNQLPTSGQGAFGVFNGVSGYRHATYLTTAGKLQLYLSSNSTSNDIASAVLGSTTVTTGAWHHIALTYYFGVYTLWLDGKAEITITNTTPLYSDFLNQLRIGASDNTASNFLIGYIDETRVSSTARYTSTFTPPTAAFTQDAYTLALNHWDGTNGATDLNLSEVIRPTPVRWDINYYNSPSLTTAQSKFGGYSMLNSATSGVAVNTGITQGIVPAQHCTEFWLYSTAATTAATLLDSLYGGYYYNLNLTSAGKITFSISTNGTSANVASGTSTATLAASTWTHIALSFDGSTYRLFINGALQASAATTTQPIAFFARCLILGCAVGKSSGAAGYFDEFRFSNTARYTTAFTPATAAFTVDSNTVVLNHFDGPSNGALYIQDGEAVGATIYCRGGLARNTHYYPYAISNGTTSQLRLSPRCISYGDTFSDLPSGYSYVRQLKLALTSNGGCNLTYFSVSGTQVTFPYNDDQGTPIGFAGQFAIGSGLTATAFATLSTINQIPKISQEALICCYIWNNTTTDSAVKVRYTGSVSPNGTTVCQATNQYINGSVTKTTAHVNDAYVSLNSGQQFDYRVTTSGCQCGFLIKGYKITEV